MTTTTTKPLVAPITDIELSELLARRRRCRMRIPESQAFSVFYGEFDSLAERLRLAEVVIEAAGHIPERPSPAHRLMTPGWNELNAALSAYRQATGNGK